MTFRAQELCESRGGRPGWAPVPNKPAVSVDVKQHFNQHDLHQRQDDDDDDDEVLLNVLRCQLTY